MIKHLNINLNCKERKLIGTNGLCKDCAYKKWENNSHKASDIYVDCTMLMFNLSDIKKEGLSKGGEKLYMKLLENCILGE